MPSVTGPLKASWAPSQNETRPPRPSISRKAAWGTGLAMIGLGLLAATIRPTAHSSADRAPAPARSSAYDFGYASAAMTVCAGIPQDLQDILAARVPKTPSARVADDIAQGFRAFSHALDAEGASDACNTAGRLMQARN